MAKSPAFPRLSFSTLFPLRDLSLKDIISSLIAGVVASILVIFLEVSLAAMVFSGEVESALSQGIGIFLLGTLIVGLFLTITSSVIPVIAFSQDSPAAIVSVIAAAIIANLIDVDPDNVVGTIIAVMMSASLTTGIVFWLLGRFNLGRLVRYIPYPVVGGFLGGTGWLLMMGGIGVMTNSPFGMELFASDFVLRWLPGVIFAIALFIIMRRFPHFLVLPCITIGSIVLFYIVFYFATGSLSHASLADWQIGPFPEGGLFNIPTFKLISEGHTYIVWHTLIDFGSIILISAIALLLNASGLELIYDEDFDLNKELRMTGIANIFGGLMGAPPGYHSISISTLGRRLGGRSRLVGFITFGIVAITLFFGASTLSFFPRFIAGGLLVYLGITFLFEWVYDGWFKLPKLDYFLIWVILIIIATVGFLEGTAAGLVVAVVLFVLNYSRVNVVRHDVTAANFPSYVVRPRLYEQLLRQRGASFYILELQGFIFFGTANRLIVQIRERIEDSELPELRFLLLDFRLVSGIDSSAALSFSKLWQQAENHGIIVVFTNLTQKFKNVLGGELIEKLTLFSTLDEGVAWCEDRMIDGFTEVGLVAKPKTIIQMIEGSLADEATETNWMEMMLPGSKLAPTRRASRLLKYLEPVQVGKGEFLIHENYDIEGLYFIENGQIREFATCEDDSTITLRILESGTVFGAVDFYAEQKASACYVSNEPSSLFYLSIENLANMEEEDPQLAFALHRIIAGRMGKTISLANKTIQALRK